MLPYPSDESFQTQQEIVTKFLSTQMAYGGRNALLQRRQELFEGHHWASDPEDEMDFQLVLNYCRNVVLRNAAIMSRSPRPRVPVPSGPGVGTQQETYARNREYLLRLVWDDLIPAWNDVEMNASKYSYGVLQVLWMPQTQEKNIGRGQEEIIAKVMESNPFKFRSISPYKFFPIYRTYDTPNDFMEVFRYDPGRLTRDIEETYGVEVMPTGGLLLDGTQVVSVEPTCDVVEFWSEKQYVLLAMTRAYVYKQTRGNPRLGDVDNIQLYTVLSEGENVYGTIPFWVLQNIRSDPNEDPTILGSVGDLDDIESLNLHMNMILSEEASEIVTKIHQPLVYKSEDHEQDPSTMAYTSGAVFPIGKEEDLDPLPWTGDPAYVQRHMDQIDGSLKDLTFLGQAGFGDVAAGVSGIGFRIALTPMQQITELKLPLRVKALESVGSYLLKCFEKMVGGARYRGMINRGLGRFGAVEVTKADIDGQYYVTIDYGNLLPRDDMAFAQNEVYMYKTGVQSMYQTLDNLGVQDPDAEIERIKKELQDPVLNPEHVKMLRELGVGGQQGQQPTQPAQPNMPPGMQQGLQNMMPQGAGVSPGNPMMGGGLGAGLGAGPGMGAGPGAGPGLGQLLGGATGGPPMGSAPPVPSPAMLGGGGMPGMPGQGGLPGPGVLAPSLGRTPVTPGRAGGR
jgi:hypothetical protein